MHRPCILTPRNIVSRSEPLSPWRESSDSCANRIEIRLGLRRNKHSTNPPFIPPLPKGDESGLLSLFKVQVRKIASPEDSGSQ